ncbi:MAG: hypothetical protein ACJ746_25095 [Bryobacteraceae bacterium]
MITTLRLGKAADSESELTRLNEAQLRTGFRTWNGNDEKGRKTHHGVINLHDSPIDLKLTWQESDSSPVLAVGCYRLNLRALLGKGYIRTEPNQADAVRLKFVHSAGAIYLRVRKDTPAINLGPLPAR